MKKMTWKEVLENIEMVKQCEDCGEIFWAERKQCFNCENAEFNTNPEDLKAVILHDVYLYSDYDTKEEFLLAECDIVDNES